MTRHAGLVLFLLVALALLVFALFPSRAASDVPATATAVPQSAFEVIGSAGITVVGTTYPIPALPQPRTLELPALLGRYQLTPASSESLRLAGDALRRVLEPPRQSDAALGGAGAAIAAGLSEGGPADDAALPSQLGVVPGHEPGQLALRKPPTPTLTTVPVGPFLGIGVYLSHCGSSLLRLSGLSVTHVSSPPRTPSPAPSPAPATLAPSARAVPRLASVRYSRNDPKALAPRVGSAASTTGLNSAPVRASLSKGIASWFNSPAGVSAAGPELRTALGSGWRGTRVTVSGPAGSAVVTLGDWMQRDRLIDLDAPAFVRVCGALTRGLCRVEVGW